MVPEQLALFADAELTVPHSTRAADRLTARAYVESVLARRCCRGCGCEHGERPLQFVHRAPERSDVPVARLVQLGAHRERLAREIARCLTLCRRCFLVGPRLGQSWCTVVAFPVGVVAKRRARRAIATCRGVTPAA